MEEIKSVVDRDFPDNSAMLDINNGDQTIGPLKLMGMVGSKDWIVIYDTDQRLRDIEKLFHQFSVKLTDVNSEMEKLKNVSNGLSKYHVQNLVCQVLLFLEGSQPEDNRGCRRFRTLKNEDKVRIGEFTKTINLNFEQFIASADALIEKRNMHIHARDVSDLNDRVEEVQQWFKDFPEWKNELLFEFQ